MLRAVRTLGSRGCGTVLVGQVAAALGSMEVRGPLANEGGAKAGASGSGGSEHNHVARTTAKEEKASNTLNIDFTHGPHPTDHRSTVSRPSPCVGDHTRKP